MLNENIENYLPETFTKSPILFLFFPIPDKSRVSLKYLQYWNEEGTDTTECNLELHGKFLQLVDRRCFFQRIEWMYC